MSFFINMFSHKYASLKLIIFFYLFCYLFISIYLKNKKRYLIKNWSKYRCKIYLAPFAGLIKPEKGKSTAEIGIKNVLTCLWLQIKYAFKVLMTPIHYILAMYAYFCEIIKNVLNTFRKQLVVIRNLLINIVIEVFTRLQNIASEFVVEFVKFRDILKRSVASFKLLVSIMEVTAYSLSGMIKGGIGDMLLFAQFVAPALVGYTAPLSIPLMMILYPSFFGMGCCFHHNTLVKTNKTNKSFDKIKKISFRKETDLIGIQLFKNTEKITFYQYKSDLVTGTHQIYYNNKWCLVKNCPLANLTTHYQEFLYCLSTSNNRIITPSATYLDWEETSLRGGLLTEKKTNLKRLNGVPTPYHIRHLYREGFPIVNCLDFNQLKLLLHKNNKITGIGVWRANKNTIWYFHKDKKYLISGSTLCYYQNKWIPVYQHSQFIRVKVNIPYVIHFQTATGMFRYQNLIIRDFSLT